MSDTSQAITDNQIRRLNIDLKNLNASMLGAIDLYVDVTSGVDHLSSDFTTADELFELNKILDQLTGFLQQALKDASHLSGFIHACRTK